MGTYEPDDSRDVTLNPTKLPGEPPRTGPREDQSRKPRDDEREPVKQTNLSQEVTDGGLPDPHHAAAGYDQDEG